MKIIYSIILLVIIFSLSCSNLFNDALETLSLKYSIKPVPGNENFLAKAGDNSEIVFVFNKQVKPDSLMLTGTLSSAANFQWSNTNSMLTLTPSLEWPIGEEKDITLKYNFETGYNSEITVKYHVVDHVLYVHNDGSDSNPGTRSEPMRTIQGAMGAIQTDTYISVILVSEGDYIIPDGSTRGIDMVNRVSIYGGYSGLEWDVRDPEKYGTILIDYRTGDSTYSTIYFDNSITAEAVVDGFIINGPSQTIGTSSSASRCIDIDSSTGIITIQNNRMEAGSPANGTSTISNGIYNNSALSVIIKNNTIIQGSAFVTQGIYSRGVSSLTIEDNTIEGGSATSTSYGIRSDGDSMVTINNNTISSVSNDMTITLSVVNSTGSVIIQGNSINGGAGDSTFGLFIDNNNGTPSINNNSINGGTASAISRALYINNEDAVNIKNNIIDGGIGDSYSYGIVVNESSCSILSNRVFGGISPVSYGISTNASVSTSPKIFNNFIHGGVPSSGGNSFGLIIDSAAYIRNNTIYAGGSSNSGITAGIQIGQTVGFTVEIKNNIIFYMMGNNRFGIRENHTDNSNPQPPYEVKNNCFKDLGTGATISAVYRDYETLCICPSCSCSLTQMESLGDMDASDNIELDPMLNNIKGSDGNVDTIIDNDWCLSSSTPASISMNGLNGANSANNWGFSTDILGISRTPVDESPLGWSIGACEKD